MKKIITILSVLLIVLANCKDDKAKVKDYDFSTEFQEPEKVEVGKPFTVTLVLKNKDKQVNDDMKMKVSFPENLTIEKGGTAFENNHIYDISFSEMENVKLTFKQKIIRDDTVRFNFANSFFNKNVEYVISAKNYKGKITVNQTRYGQATQTKEYRYGDSVELKATPETGRLFAGWFDETQKDDDGNVISKLVSLDNPYKFKFTKQMELTPRFDLSKIVITLNATAGGTVHGGGNYEYGSLVTATATPKTGHKFDGWYEKNKKLHDQLEFQIEAKTARTIEGRFSPQKYVITLTAGSGGKASGGGEYEYGKSVTVTAVANANYGFEGWYEGNTKVSPNSNYSFVVAGTRNLQARFIPKKYIVTLVAGAGGAVQGGGEYAYGTTITVKAHPSEHYTFEGWYENGAKISSDTDYTFVVTKSITLKANFKVKQYTVSLSNTAGGSVSGGGTFDYGRMITLAATPKEGYKFEGWFSGGNLMSRAVNFQYGVSGNISIEGRFSTLIFQPKFAVNIPEAGTITGQQPQYEYGDLLDVTVADNNARIYEWKGWFKNGSSLSTNRTLHFNIKDQADYEARYEIKSFDVSFNLLRARALKLHVVVNGMQYWLDRADLTTITIPFGSIIYTRVIAPGDAGPGQPHPIRDYPVSVGVHGDISIIEANVETQERKLKVNGAGTFVLEMTP